MNSRLTSTSRFRTLPSQIYFAADFNKSTFVAELSCANQTCLDMSLEESKICKPLVKPTKTLDKQVLVLLILNGLSIFFMVCFDILFQKQFQNGHRKSKKPLSTFLFTTLFATIILYLSSGSFDKLQFCSMNIKEKICKHQNIYKHVGALHNVDDPLYVSAPCKVFPTGLELVRDSDILDINQTISPCTLELRSRFFIENFEMRPYIRPS